MAGILEFFFPFAMVCFTIIKIAVSFAHQCNKLWKTARNLGALRVSFSANGAHKQIDAFHPCQLARIASGIFGYKNAKELWRW